MLLIVCHHFSVHGAIHANKLPILAKESFLNLLWLQTLGAWGTLGVNLFVLITGYFLIKTAPRLSSLIKIYIITISITLPVYLLFVIIGRTPFSYSSLVKNLFPITTGQYWFITCYAVLFVLVPFIGLGLRKIYNDKTQIFDLNPIENKHDSKSICNSLVTPPLLKHHHFSQTTSHVFPATFGYLRVLFQDNVHPPVLNLLKVIFLLQWLINYDRRLLSQRGFIIGLSLIATTTLLFSFFPTFITKGNWPSFFTNQLIWFVVLFCWASFLSYFEVRLSKNAPWVLLFSFVLIIIRIIYIDYQLKMNQSSSTHWFYLSSQTSFVILIISIIVFLYFNHTTFNFSRLQEKLISFFAPATLGIYLIHDNNYVRSVLWSYIFNTKKHFYSESFFLWSLYVIVVVFLISAILDRFINVIEKPFITRISSYMEPIDLKIKQIFK